MKKTKKIIKKALKHPERFTEAELLYFELYNKERKRQKKIRKENLAVE